MKLFLTTCLIISLHLQPLAQTTKLSRKWTAFAQLIEVSTIKKAVQLSPGNIKLRITAQVKLVTKSKESWAGVWVRGEKKEGKTTYFDNMRDRKIQSPKWHTYMVEAELNPSTHKVYFGGLYEGNGKFYFDNFEVSVQNKQGNYQKLPLPNASFEEKVASNTLSQWFEGIRINRKVRIKEYTMSSSTDKVHGKYALSLEGSGITFPSYLIGPIKGYTPQVGAIVTMLNNLSARVESAVKNLSQEEIDWQEDDRANSIGALVIHLAATEAYYQTYTFENRMFNKEETLKWAKAFGLGKKGRGAFKGNTIDYYLNICKEVRKKTLEKLKTLDDEWLAKELGNGKANNHYCWFHVMEHQANHLGQIYLIKKKMKQKKSK